MDFNAILQSLDEPLFCEGTLHLDERVAVMLPNGDLAAADDPQFVEWLVAHGEMAPFGTAAETKVDPAVRLATRLIARSAATIGGFDPAMILDEVEASLSPRTHLVAKLTDVLVYEVGGHFASHQGHTEPPALIGTLVVGLPLAHEGGAFEIEGTVIDWSGPVEPNTVRWVAMFSDTDHAVQRVDAGTRVTLVYSLSLSDWKREDRGRDVKLAALHAAARDLELGDRPLMIACSRQVIALDGPQPQRIETLRGADRDIADVLVSAGFQVAVRTCVAARDVDGYDVTERFRAELGRLFYARLREPLLATDVAALLECVTFDPPWGADGGGLDLDEVTSLVPWIAERSPAEDWVVRSQAAATFLRALEFADDGWIGNGTYEIYLYKLAALEVTRGARESSRLSPNHPVPIP